MSKRKLKECKASGAGAHNIKKYVFADQMQFLNKLYQSREVAESLEGRTDNNEDEVVDNPPETPLPPKRTICENPKPREFKRRRQPDEVELKMIKALEEQSPHIPFIQGLLPHLNKFDDTEILEFQMGVLDLISKIKNKRKNTAQPQLLPPQTPSYYPNNYPFPQYQSFPTPQKSYPNQFSATNSFQSQQPQIYQSPNPQTQHSKIHKIPITAIQTTSRHALRKDSHLNNNKPLHNIIKILATLQQPHLQRPVHRRALPPAASAYSGAGYDFAA